MKVDIIIPTLKPLGQLVSLMYEVRKTATGGGDIIATCEIACAARNRNIGLDRSKTDIVIMIDDDVCNFPQGWDEALAKVVADDPLCMMSSARLLNPDGSLGQMLGHPPGLEDGSLWTAHLQELPTACIAMRKSDLRYDEDFVGSGWEDTGYAAAIRTREPNAKFIVHGGVRVTHINEMKNQGGKFFQQNRATYVRKWGEPR